MDCSRRLIDASRTANNVLHTERQAAALLKSLTFTTARRTQSLSNRIDVVKRVNWNAAPLENDIPKVPDNLLETIFDDLPPALPMKPAVAEMAHKYRSGEWIKTPQHYAIMQAAYFIQPNSPDFHKKRRDSFRLRTAEAEADGFVVPDNFRKLVETDAYVDRLHHNSIWLEMPEELWRLPSDPSRAVFLAFVEGHAGCGWHLLLADDGSHSVVFCKHPFGLPSNWPGQTVPEYSQWTVERCADSIEEWLYHYFVESAEHDRVYIERLRADDPDGWSG